MIIIINDQNNIEIISVFLTAIGLVASLYVTIIQPKNKKVKAHFNINEDQFLCVIENIGYAQLVLKEIDLCYLKDNWIEKIPFLKKYAFKMVSSKHWYDISRVHYLSSVDYYNKIENITKIDSRISEIFSLDTEKLAYFIGHKYEPGMLPEEKTVYLIIKDIDNKKYIFKTKYTVKEYFDHLNRIRNYLMNIREDNK